MDLAYDESTVHQDLSTLACDIIVSELKSLYMRREFLGHEEQISVLMFTSKYVK